MNTCLGLSCEINMQMKTKVIILMVWMLYSASLKARLHSLSLDIEVEFLSC